MERLTENLDRRHIVDVENLFADSIDENYNFESVGGSFECMQPSAVLRLCDPTAFRCGVNDYADWLLSDDHIVEYEGEHWNADHFRDTVAETIEEVEAELDQVAAEVEEVEAEDEPDKDELAHLEETLAALRAELDYLNDL